MLKTKYGFTASAKENGTVKFVRITDIQSGKINWTTVPFCECDNPEEYLLHEGDILVARTGGTVGKTFLISEKIVNAIFASYLIRLRIDKQKALPKFIFYFLNSYSYWSQIAGAKSGSAQPNVNAEKLKDILIPYCNLEIQEEMINLIENKEIKEKNVAIMEGVLKKTIQNYDRIDEFKNKNLELLYYTAKLRQAILEEAFSGKLVPQDPNDEPASEVLRKIKAMREKIVGNNRIRKEIEIPSISKEDVPYELPRGWEWTRLGNVSEIIAGNSFRSQDFNSTNGIKVIKITNCGVKKFVETEDYLPKNFLDDYSDFTIQENDLIVALTRPYISSGLKVCMCPKSYNGSLLNQRVAAIKNVFNINSIYLFCYLTTDYVLNKYKTRFNSTGLQPNLKISDLTCLEYPFPPLAEQLRITQKISALLSLCDELYKKVKENQNNSELLMETILKEAFAF